MAKIELSEYDYDYVSKLVQAIFELYTRPGIDYEKDQDWIEEDVNEIKQEIGDRLFDLIIGEEKAAVIFAIKNPPEPEPEPLPVPKNDNEAVAYCRQCGKPAVFIGGDVDGPMRISHCSNCGYERKVIVVSK